MSRFAEIVQAILVISVIGLAVRNRKLKREKEILSEQLCRMREKEEGRNPEPVPMQATQLESDPVAPSADGLWTFPIQNTSCPDCGCTEFEMRTYGGPWEYADTHCAGCGKLIRRFDAA